MVDQKSIFVIGANGQLGSALRTKYPGAKHANINELDIADKQSVDNFDWDNVEVIINAAGYTDVDGAETSEGRKASWLVNATAVGYLVNICRRNDITLVHISSDYVFDGGNDPHTENEALSPLSVYGASKAAGDLLVISLEKYYLLRTSWVIGEGKNFVRTMIELGKKGVNPSVINDQMGRLTFTNEIVKAIDHLFTNNSNFGIYNITNSGDSVSWAEITRQIFEYASFDLTVTDITTDDYYKDMEEIAPRPLKSTLDLGKIESTGFKTKDWRLDLKDYVQKETK